MARIHAVELEDLEGFPSVFRDAGTAYLRFAAERGRQAAHIAPLIGETLERSGEKEILDLCSGGGGPAIEIVRVLHADGRPVTLTLTDLYPSQNAMQLVARLSGDLRDRVRFAPEPTDAGALSGDRAGLRTLFNAFHHFRPEGATRILRSAVEARKPIAVVEVLQRKPLNLIAMLFAPFLALLAVPFLRPFRLAWLPFTYLLPVIPLFILWDGMVSCLRVYSAPELRALIADADPEETFDWRIEEIEVGAPVPGLTLVGIPKERLHRSSHRP